MLLEAPRSPLRPADLPEPEPGPGQVLIRVHVCGVCRTDLHVVDGELPDPKLPLVIGHQIVGTVEAWGRALPGRARGSAFPGSAGRTAPAATAAPAARTSATRRGSPATSSTADTPNASWRTSASASRSPRATRISRPRRCSAPGLIGYRSLRMTGDAERLGLYGFGASAHIVAQVAKHQGRKVFAFTRAGDEKGQAFARSLGADWAGSSDDRRPSRSTRRSSSRPSARSCRPRSPRPPRAASSSAPGST